MTPIVIHTVLSIYAQVLPTLNKEGIRQCVRDQLITGPAVGDEIGIITSGLFALTPQGRALTKMLLATPLPVLEHPMPKWVDPRDEKEPT